MDRLKELETLINLSKTLGQDPDQDLLEDYNRTKKLQEDLKKRTKSASKLLITSLTNPESNSDVLSSVPILEGEETQAQILIDESQKLKDFKEPILEVNKPNNVDLVAQSIKETVVSQGEPLLVPKPTDPLTKKVELLEKWISRIAATGPGSGEVNFRWLDDVDRSSIDENKYLTYNATTKKFQFVDTRVSTEAFDRSSSIVLLSTPTLLKPSSSTNVKNMTYDSSTGIFTFLTQCEVSLAISLNALSTAAGQRVYQYAERNTGSGWVVIPNSGKSFQLTNTQHTQIVNAQTISRLEGEQIRYYIYTDSDKVNLITETLPHVTGSTVYVPAIRIQYAGR